MAYFQTFRSDGPLQFDANLMTMALVGKGTVTTQARVSGNTNPSSALVPLPNLTDPLIIAVQSSFFAARAGRYMNGGQAVAHFACSGAIGSTMNYWLFNQTKVFTPAFPGLNLWDQAGNLTYSSGRPVCTIAAILNGTGQSATLWANRTFALAAQEWTGHHIAGAALYRNGVPYEPGDGGGGTQSYTWSTQYNGKLYGCSVNGATVATGNVSYDDVRAINGTGRYPVYPPESATWTRPMGNVLVIDVTGL